MSSDTPSKEDVLGMDLNGLCEILEEMGVDYSSLEDLEEIRDLVLKSVDEQNASVSESRKSQVCVVQSVQRKTNISYYNFDVFRITQPILTKLDIIHLWGLKLVR